MKVLVCAKIVNDYDHVLSEDWRKMGRFQEEIAYSGEIYSCFDEAALELALSLKDEKPEVTLEALTVGNVKKRLLENLLAVGFDRVTALEHEGDAALEFVPEAVAHKIADYIGTASAYDVILMGNRAGAGDSGQVPFYTAQMLDIPCISRITKLYLTENTADVICQDYAKGQKMKLKLPAVFTVGNTSHAYLRMATLREKLEAKKKKIDRLTEALPQENQKTILADLILADLLPNVDEKICKRITAGSAREKAEQLWELLCLTDKSRKQEVRDEDDCSQCIESID